MPPSDPYHSFTKLVLTISEAALGDIRTDHCFELRSTGSGAEVWRSSILFSGDQTCESDARLIGFLSSRQVIELLVEIERSGIYEALPALGIVQGAADPDATPVVSMKLCSGTRTRDVISSAPADEVVVGGVVRAVREAVALAQERALSFAG